MRRPLPHARLLLTHAGHTAALLIVAVLAMAVAPVSTPENAAFVKPAPPPVRAVARPAGPVTRAILFVEPVTERGINSPYGMRRLGGEPGARLHKGVDIAAPTGTPVLATAEARVLRIGHDAGGYGAFIELSHPNGMTSLYGHLSRIDVASGDAVGAGAQIGLVGSTGYSTGPHLHFEVRRADAQVNPVKVIGRAFQIWVKPPAT